MHRCAGREPFGVGRITTDGVVVVAVADGGVVSACGADGSSRE